MRCLDSSFLIDLLNANADAVQKMRSMEESGEAPVIAAPSLAEILVGAYFKGGAALKRTLGLISGLEVLEVGSEEAAEAGRLGAELMKRGQAMQTSDLLIAATAKLRQHILVTRDTDFARIPGLAVESY